MENGLSTLPASHVVPVCAYISQNRAHLLLGDFRYNGINSPIKYRRRAYQFGST